MKKLSVLLIILCHCLSISAQQPNNYIYKLDSVRYVNDAVEVFQYDDNFNCTEIKTTLLYVSPNQIYDIKTFSYDNENRIIRTDYDELGGEYREIHEYSYNDNGLLAEDIRSTYYAFYTYEEQELSRYEYDEDKQLIDSWIFGYSSNGIGQEHIHTHYEYENGLLVLAHVYYWGHDVPDGVTTYTYDTIGLCVEIVETEHGSEIKRTASTYDEEGRLSSQTVQGFDWDDQWVVISKTEYIYDINGNCTTWDHENYDVGDHTQYILAYDNSIHAKEIAGIANRWDFDFSLIDMPLYYYRNDLIFGSCAGPITFHYSSCTGTEETTESQILLWPNPVSDYLHFNLTDTQCVAVYTLDGRLVLSAESSETINVESLPVGCYVLKAVFSDGKQKTMRFMKN